MRLLQNIWTGMLAGITGAAAMHAFRLVWETAVSRESRHAIFGFDREADVNAARLAYGLFSNEFLAETRASSVGMVMHYVFGATLGIVYNVTERLDDSDVLFSLLLWLCADEIPISLSGISDPFAKSAASHVSALAAHLLFGITTGAASRVLQFNLNSSQLRRIKYACKETEPMLAGI